jgi:hypothetical protein
MTVLQSTELRGVIGVTMAVASVVAWQTAPRLRMTADRFFALFLGAFAVSRVGLFALAFGVLHLQPHGDISLYMEEALPALSGKLVYRDFPTMHAPLNPYLFAAMLRLHHSPLTIMFFGVLFDIGAMYLWMKAAPYFLSRLTLRRAALLVLFNPTSLLTDAIDGQMNSLIALFLALGVYLLVRHRDFLSGAAVAAPAAIIKFLTLIFAPGYLFAVPTARRKLFATLGFVGVLIAVYLPFALAGADLRVPLQQEGNHETAGNLVYLIEFISGHPLGLRLPDVLLALSWFAVVGLVFVCMRNPAGTPAEARRRTLSMLTVSLFAELLCIQVFSKNTWDRYLVMTMFPLCIVAAELSFVEIFGYAAWASAACFEPSYWAGSLVLPTSLEAHARLAAGERGLYILTVLEAVVVLGNLFLLLTCLRALVRLRTPATQPEGITEPELPGLPEPEPA